MAFKLPNGPHAPCAHIYEYYKQKWIEQPCIGYKLLMRGYYWPSIGHYELSNTLFAYHLLNYLHRELEHAH